MFKLKTKIGVLRTSEFSPMLHTCENSDAFNTLNEIYLVFASKSRYLLCIWSIFVCIMVYQATFAQVFCNCQGVALTKL